MQVACYLLSQKTNELTCSAAWKAASVEGVSPRTVRIESSTGCSVGYVGSSLRMSVAAQKACAADATTGLRSAIMMSASASSPSPPASLPRAGDSLNVTIPSKVYLPPACNSQRAGEPKNQPICSARTVWPHQLTTPFPELIQSRLSSGRARHDCSRVHRGLIRTYVRNGRDLVGAVGKPLRHLLQQLVHLRPR
jgi:hypothetical protein